MKQRYYSFFAIMRMAMANKRMHFSAPGNKIIYKILMLMRERGLIVGFSLDFDRPERKGYWHGYPVYKVFLKYSYWGYPVIKKLEITKATRTNFTTLKMTKYNYYNRISNNNYYIVNTTAGIRVINNNEIMKLPITVKLLAKIKV